MRDISLFHSILRVGRRYWWWLQRKIRGVWSQSFWSTMQWWTSLMRWVRVIYLPRNKLLLSLVLRPPPFLRFGCVYNNEWKWKSQVCYNPSPVCIQLPSPPLYIYNPSPNPPCPSTFNLWIHPYMYLSIFLSTYLMSSGVTRFPCPQGH